MILESCQQDQAPLRVNNGYLDLSEWDYQKEEKIRLSGEWEFYWEQVPKNEEGEFALSNLNNKEYINVPNTWTSLGYPQKGYGTYRVRICLPKTKGATEFKLKIPRLNFAGEVWGNGGQIYSIGKFSTKKNESISHGKPAYIEIPKGLTELDLIIVVSNFSHRNGGGFTQGAIFGNASKIEQKRNLSIIIQASSSFFIIVICLYQLFIFMTHRREKLFLYFGAFCLIASLRQLFVGEVLIYEFFPHISFANIIIWRNIPLSMGGIFFILYYKELYPEDNKAWFFKLVLGVCILSFIFVIITPTFLKTQTRLINRYLAVSVLIYVLWLSFVGVLKRRRLANSIFTGSIIAVALLSYDLLYLDNIIVNSTGFLTNFALLSFIILQTDVNFRFTKEVELEVLMLSEKVKSLLVEVKSKKQELTRLHSESIQQFKIKQDVTEKLNKIYKTEGASFLSEIIAELKSHRINDERILILKENLQETNYEFINRLVNKHPNLTKTDIEICSFIRSGFTSTEIANLRFTSNLSVKSSRYRIRKKLVLNQDVRLTNYLRGL